MAHGNRHVQAGDDGRMGSWKTSLCARPILRRAASSSSGPPVPKDANQKAWMKTMFQDLVRTRADEICSEARGVMSEILLKYCKTRNIAYKQGMNELLAPLVLLFYSDTDSHRNDILSMFSAMLDRFLPGFYDDDDFKALAIMFDKFGQLILYHLPKVSRQLETHLVHPAQYATSWFLTLFARQISILTIADLWDALFAYADDPTLYIFIAVALVKSRQDAIISCNVAELPSLMASICSDVLGTESVASIVEDALALSQRTSRAFRRELFSPDTLHVCSIPCMAIAPLDVVASITGDDDIKLLLLDARSETEFNSGHLPCSVLLDRQLLDDTESFFSYIISLSGMGDAHFCLIGSGHDDDDVILHRVALHLLQNNIAHSAHHQPTFALHIVDHDKSTCRECISPEPSASDQAQHRLSLRSVYDMIWERRKSSDAATPPNEEPTAEHVEASCDLDLTTLCAGGDVSMFRATYDGSELHNSNTEEWSPCLVALSSGYVLCLEQRKQDPSKARVIYKHALHTLSRITKWKDDDAVVVFYWQAEQGDTGDEFASIPVRIVKSGACIARIKALAVRCRQARLKNKR
ncbi:unnamed protein product (mitochondrion) [Plasmodiophora brassicae]|uniref:TBC1 domain family member 23 n=1 Tax=Plasmodiophora brassicae TaxID=37360 RepID=A0A3P3YCP1_PLABS|nr:unnamed protein product [Plasmodiophora brassicae]